ncbi:hypothetical protein BHE74_00020318 [Ensete ventricosum]|nr:hypothetical protein BHE74_00020318 [Ensete ventricosum]RZR82255.1 hypothetical protein BHM03_00008626 [Ensete ventricosum]
MGNTVVSPPRVGRGAFDAVPNSLARSPHPNFPSARPCSPPPPTLPPASPYVVASPFRFIPANYTCLV